MGEGGEVTVDQAKLGDAIARLERGGEDFGALVTAYQGTTCDAPAAFGDFGLPAAWSAFDGAWAAELRQTNSALTELIAKMKTSAVEYCKSDALSAHRVQSAGPR